MVSELVGSGFSLGKIAPRNEVSTHTFTVGGAPTTVSYYRNRITLESDLDEMLALLTSENLTDGEESLSDAARRNEVSQLKAAQDLCRLVVSWDWTGELRNKRDDIVVAEGEPIPLDPNIVRLIPIRLTQGLNTAIVRRELGGNDASKPKPLRPVGSIQNSTNSN